MRRALYHWELRRRAFQQAKEHVIWMRGRKIRPQEIKGLNVGNSLECLGANLDPSGVRAKVYI